MKVQILTNEFPPNIYGGAGVHVDYLTRELGKLVNVDVRCFGNQIEEIKNVQVKGYDVPGDLLKEASKELKSPLGAMIRSIMFNADIIDADIVHCHTWYSHFAGILAKILYKKPLVITTHSLEPLRPWKREQIGNGYDLSVWIEKTALEMADGIIAVSGETKNDIVNNFRVESEKIEVIANGIDLNEFKFTEKKDALKEYNIPENEPYLLFVGRITRQKGIIHLLNAIKYLDPEINVVLCAGAPDTKEIAEEMKKGVSEAKKLRKNVFWIEETVPKEKLIQLYSHAGVFCCPSIYEPFGIINLEAMACMTPVVGSKVGGIKEIIIDNKTGILVPFEQEFNSPFEAIFPDQFAKDLAQNINLLMKDHELRRNMAIEGRKRVEQEYSWESIAKKVVDLYKAILEKRNED